MTRQWMDTYKHVWRSPTALWGISLLCTGLLMPLLVDQADFGVLQSISYATDVQDSGRLLAAALRLVTLNTVRAVPIYFGAFLIGEAAWSSGVGMQRLLGYALPIGVIPLIYWGIQHAYGIAYDLGVPAFLGICSLMLLHRVTLHTHSARNRSILLLLLLHAFQWLDMAPILTHLGFGRGELSLFTKTAAEFLGAADVLNLWSLTLAGFLSLVAVLTGKFMVDANEHLALLEQARKQELAVERDRLGQLEARTTRETQSLVHDLKTPLTTIEGLASLIKMVTTEQSIVRHAEAIEHAAERMRAMISEMLYPEPAQILTLGEIVEFVRAQMPGQRDYVKFYVENADTTLRVNRIRLARALVNIIRNGIESESTQPVAVRAWADHDHVHVTVADSGCGIPESVLTDVWQAGYSTKGGSGLGLTFARTVIESDHSGSISVETVIGQGTTFHVTLPCETGVA